MSCELLGLPSAVENVIVRFIKSKAHRWTNVNPVKRAFTMRGAAVDITTTFSYECYTNLLIQANEILKEE